MNTTDCKDGVVEKALADVEQAAGDVGRAAGALAAAQEKLVQAEHELEDAEAHRKGFDVKVLYNGLEREVPAKPEELVRALLAKAIAAFPGVVNPHMLSLFTKEGRELNDSQTLRDAGVKPCETLLLRPGAVKGGGQ